MKSLCARAAGALLVLLAAVGVARAADAVSEPTLRVSDILDTLTVIGRRDDLIGVAASASEIRVGAEDLRRRPLLREAELLETNPGLIATQHSGDGKSNQLFLRGFNLDHGTDFLTVVEDMPVNMPTHGHGHGYTDVNFLIPELVSHLEFRKGVYFAEVGDFGSAGSAAIRLAAALPRPFVKMEAGADAYRRVVAGASGRAGSGTILAGIEAKGYDGPWEKPEDLEKIGGLARWSARTAGGDSLSFLAMAYDNSWESSDQIPRRAVDAGTISARGQVDPTLGGSSSRYSLSGRWSRERSASALVANLFALRYDLDLFSNFTYFAADSVNGDQIEQVDERIVLGGSLAHRRRAAALGRDHSVEAGVQVRADFMDEIGLHRTSARRRISTVREDGVTESTVGAWANVVTPWGGRIRSEIGVRGDVFAFDVDSRTQPLNSGSETATMVSPKASLVAGPFGRFEAYANAGLGFHSNDARGAVIQVDPETGQAVGRVDPLVRSRGAEIGLRAAPWEGCRSTVALWLLGLDSELIFVGDAGSTEPSDESRRYGIELANFVRVGAHVSVDLDLSLSRARLLHVGSSDRIPGALERVLAAGVMWDLPSGMHGALRLRHLGEYPLIEDDSVRADDATLVNASLGWRIGQVSTTVSVLNLFDDDGADIQYFYGSRLQGEAASETEDVHFHPVEPRQLRVAASYGF
jgi:hypothetical protein